MLATHRFEVIGTCPLNGSADHYAVEVEVNRFVEVYGLVDLAKALLLEPCYQEDFTQKLAIMQMAKVTTTVAHGPVTSTVVVDAL